MQNSKLIQALQLLSGKQLLRFGDFMVSPYFNKSEEIHLLFQALKKYAPTYTPENLNKSQFLQTVPFLAIEDTKKLSNLMSELLGLLEKFLVVEALEVNPVDSWLQLYHRYEEVKLDKHAKSIQRKIESWLEAQPYREANYFHKRYLLQKSLNDHSNTTKREYNSQLQSASDALDHFYIIEKLRLCCQMVNYEKTLDIHYQPHFLEGLLATLNEHPFSDSPAISIYLNVLKMLRDVTNTSAYFELKKRLPTHASIFTAEELKQIYTTLLNFCTRRVTHLHDHAFEKEYFELNSYLLDQGLLLDNGELSPWRYSNLVTVALRLNEVAWTKNFIHQYKKVLPASHAENMFQYKSGQLYYHIGDLKKAQTSLNQVELKDPFLALSVKNLLTKIYFETGETELLLSFLEAYRIAILRDKLIQPVVKKQVRHFIDATRKLTKIADHENEKLQVLKNKLPPEKEMMHRDWIIEQIDKKLNR